MSFLSEASLTVNNHRYKFSLLFQAIIFIILICTLGPEYTGLASVASMIIIGLNYTLGIRNNCESKWW